MLNRKDIVIERPNLQGANFDRYNERQYSFATDSGGMFTFRETTFSHLQFVECNYQFHDEERICIEIESSVLEMHFRMRGSSIIRREHVDVPIQQANNMLTLQNDRHQEVAMDPEQNGYFYEIRIGDSHFEKLLSDFYRPNPRFFLGTPMLVTPEMRLLVSEMTSTSYSGTMKPLYLESKMTELFLLQLQQNHLLGKGKSLRIRNAEKDKIQYAKQMIECNADRFLTVSELAQLCEMTPRKLMSGFKALFNITVFQYVIEIKMLTARSLLMDTDKHINEIAWQVGYQNPQHFITAFKRRFGLSPGKIKNYKI